MSNRVEEIQKPIGLQYTAYNEERQDCVETDSVTPIELESNRRLLYFSDGTMEEPSDSENEEAANDVVDSVERCLANTLKENELPLVPRLKYKASKMGNNILAGIDFVGGSLAEFFGISTPKYASEIEYYKRAQQQHTEAEEENANETWCNDLATNDKHLNEVVVTAGPKNG